MKRVGLPALACLASLIAGPSVAKNDIRGITTGQPLVDALDTLELDGAICAPPARGMPMVCSYDDRTSLTLYAEPAPPSRVAKMVYSFHFRDIAKMRDKLQQLYGLRRDRIEGEHKLFTGENLGVELKSDGTGSLTIVNGRLMRKDRAAEAR